MKRQQKILHLLSLKSDRERILSRTYQKEIDRYFKIVSYWKRKYGLPSNDPRYLTATYTEILEDVLEDDLETYVQRFEWYDSETNHALKQMELDPEYGEVERQKLVKELESWFTAEEPKTE